MKEYILDRSWRRWCNAIAYLIVLGMLAYWCSGVSVLAYGSWQEYRPSYDRFLTEWSSEEAEQIAWYFDSV